jgi:hypothetical protein
VADGAVAAVPADRGELPEAEGRVLGLEFDDGAPDLGREESTGSRRRRRGVEVEEALHAPRREAGDLAAQGALGHGRFAGAGGDRLAEEHDRPEQLVGFLFRRADQEAQLVPVVCGLAARSRAGRHDPSPGRTRSPRRAVARRGDGPYLSRRCRPVNSALGPATATAHRRQPLHDEACSVRRPRGRGLGRAPGCGGSAMPKSLQRACSRLVLSVPIGPATPPRGSGTPSSALPRQGAAGVQRQGRTSIDDRTT